MGSDAADLGNLKAASIEEEILRSQMTVSYKYIVAYCSGDGGKLTTEPIEGVRRDREILLMKRGIDIDQANNWAFAQWSDKELLWIVAGGDGPMKERLKSHLREQGKRCR